ncbi:MAG: pyrroloquinoline quinone-dependent dehydrogenase [Acidobacteriota bacterium]|nr:pyrroloquinoline quinone-dependent dehydrogenase [Acidobacteriota bacterium]
MFTHSTGSLNSVRRGPEGARFWSRVFRVAVLGVSGWLAVASAVPAQYGAPATGEWPTYGGDLGSTKYSPLEQIDAENFADLEVAWRWRSSDRMLSVTTPDGGEWLADSRLIFDELNRRDPDRWRDGQPPTLTNLKATPLMVGGRLFINMPTSAVAAVDARTGRTLWVYNPKSYEEGTTTMSARWNQRGVAYWSNGPDRTDERIFFGTGNGYVICVDAKTGRPCADFGEAGRLDLMADLPRANRGDRDWLNALPYSVQSPPIVFGDTVVTPMSISSYNIRKEMPPGWMRGFDVKTGATQWTFHTIPQGDEFGNDTWGGDSWRETGKVGVWTMMSIDPELGYIYLPLNTPAPDYYGGHRPGRNLFAESLVALDLETGERVWHFQFVHHGLWDYDIPAAPNLIDITVAGRRIKAVAQITKQGFTFVFDRATGEPVWPIEERSVPTDTDIEGEVPWPTQPFPTRPAPFDYQGVTIDDLVDFTSEIREMAVRVVAPFRIGPLYTPHSQRGTIVRPGFSAGSWSGAAVDPESGILYVPSGNRYAVKQFREPAPGEDASLRIIEKRPADRPQMPQGLPLFKPPYSRMTAIDMNTGEHVWMQPMGRGDRIRNLPMLRDLDLPPLGGDSNRAGPVLTKTLLIYALTAGGTNDGPRLVALDKRTGEEIASVDLPGGAIGTPMTYMVDGRQYVALTVGGSSVPELITLTLPVAEGSSRNK